MKSKPPIRETNSKRRRKLKPVYHVLPHAIQILPLLINHNMGKNVIYDKIRQLKQPGLNDKVDTIHAICHLQCAGLIKQQEDKGKELQELTPLGRELAEMMIGSDQYKISWLALKDAYDNNFTKQKQKGRHTLPSILRINGWNEDETEWFDHYDEKLEILLWYAYEDIIPNVLQERFEAIINNSGKKGEITKMIIDNLILNTNEYDIPILLRDIKEDYRLTTRKPQDEDLTRYIDRYTETHWSTLFYFSEASGQYYYPKAIFNEVKNMLLSMLIILKPPQELVLEWIQKLKSNIEEEKRITIPSITIPEPERRRRIVYESSKNENCVLSAYEEYLNKLA